MNKKKWKEFIFQLCHEIKILVDFSWPSLLNGKYSSVTHWERYLIFLFFSDFLSKNAIDLENRFFFLNFFSWSVLIEMKCF